MPWPPTGGADRMACEPEGRREAVICAAGTSWGTLRRLPSSVGILHAVWQAFGSRQGLPSKVALAAGGACQRLSTAPTAGG
eukprot:scaffold106675_cov43-Phaeocystis_antarctica.AAC.1